MKVEKVQSALAEPWMHVRRMTHGEFKAYVKAAQDEPLSASTRIVAVCLCDSKGESKCAKFEDALAYVDTLDWKLVRDIADEATKFCGMDVSPQDAEKNS